MQIRLGHARLDQRGAGVDIDVHRSQTRQIQNEAARVHGQGRSVAEVATSADGPQRRFVAVGQGQHLADRPSRAHHDGASREPFAAAGVLPINRLGPWPVHHLHAWQTRNFFKKR